MNFPAMPMSLEMILISVWEETLLDRKSGFAEMHGYAFPVTLTSRKKLKQVDFKFRGRRLRGIEQNPETNSRWAKIAKAGKESNAVCRKREIHRGRR